ncbi:MAG: TonB-dependent receptor [Bacteroidales bacterium]|nr:TonB-dependent receptor [Bacteroidales bacterium]
MSENSYLRKIVLFFLLMLFIQKSNSQVSGYILDAENDYPLTGVNIIASNGNFAITDIQGKFSINKDTGIDTLSITYIGYKSIKQIVTPRDSILIIRLQSASYALKTAIITSYQSSQNILSVPGSINVISSGDIQMEHPLNIAPLLNKIPGIYMHSGALNTNRIVIRGFGSRSPYSSNRIKAYFDDIPLTTGDGQTVIEDIDLSNIGSVEIIKGPTSSIYGSGLGGTINYKSKNLFYNHHLMDINTQIGSFGMVKYNIIGGLGKDNFYINTNFSNLQREGYRENSRFNRNSAVLLTGFRNTKVTGKLLLNYIDLKAFIPSSLNENTYINNPSSAAGNWLAVKGYEKYKKLHTGMGLIFNINPNLFNFTTLYGSMFDSYETRPFNILSESSVAGGFRSRFMYLQTSTRFISKYIIGGELFTENYNWKTYQTISGVQGSILSNNAEKRHHLNVFGQYDLTIKDQTLISIGINFNQTLYLLDDKYYSDSIDQSADFTFRPIISPRIAANYSFHKNLAVFASLSHGFSNPSVEETLYPDGAINPQIKPEQGYNIEFGSRGSVFENHILYDISVYSAFVKDLIVPMRLDEDQFIGLNAGKTIHRGFESSFKVSVLPEDSDDDIIISCLYSLSDIRFREFIKDTLNYANKKLPGIPRQILNTSVFWRHREAFYGIINYSFTGKMFVDDANTLAVKSYNLVNISVGYKRNFNNFSLHIFAGVQNVLNEHYASMILVNALPSGNNAPRYYYPGDPRNYYAGINLSWKKPGKYQL